MNISNALFITEAQDDFFCFIPQTSEQSMIGMFSLDLILEGLKQKILI